ncbi:MAG: FtsX-like permease family protein [Gemmatimonas sp.]|nr:FtsX-like permease family protein [Gemmatimonas sp.]
MHDWTSEVQQRLGRAGAAGELDESVVEELVQHLEDRYAELRAGGTSHASAVAATLDELASEEALGQQFKNPSRLRHPPAVAIGASGPGGALESLWNDLRYGIRLATRRPVYTGTIVLTLALGIGATTAIFSVVNTILLREPPFTDMDELVVIWETDRDSETFHEPASWPDIVDFRERSQTLAGIGALNGVDATWLREDAESERLSGLAVTGNLPALLGVSPVLGNTLDEDRIAAGEAMVLLGEHIWRSRLGADPAVVGSTLRLNGEPMTVVGVLPSEADVGVNQILARADYGGPFNGRHVDVWIGMAPTAAVFPRETHPFFTVGRLAPGMTVEVAQRELASVAAELESAYPENAARGVNIEALSDVVFGPSRPALLVLLGAVGLVLLITCANVANLMMARIVGRRRELALRAALGARGGRMASQLLMEALLVTSLGAAAGLTLAYAGIRSIVAIAPDSIPRIDEVSIDWTVLALLAGLTIAVTLILGVLPMRRAWWSELRSSLQGAGGGRSSDGAAGARTRAGLVVSQTALAVALVIGAGILLRSFVALLNVDPGFDTDRVIKAEFQLSAPHYAVDLVQPETYTRITNFYAQVLGRIRSIPGVEEASFAVNHPLQPGFTNSFAIVGREAESSNFPEIRTRFVTPAYQETLGIPQLSGRTLAESDDAVSPQVGVLNRAAAERYFPNSDPIGQEIRFWGILWRVVGVMGDERFLGLDRETEPAIYLSLQQMPLGGGSLLVRANEDVAVNVGPIRNAVRDIDPEIVLYGIETLDETLAATVGRPRFTATLIGMFAALAILIALVGLHGLLSYSVSQRTPELGIRKALGASESNLRRLVLGEGLRLAVIGVAIGAGLALIGSRMLESLVFGVSAADPYTFAGVTALVLGAALLASWLPARRASSSDPLALLRAD